MSDINLLPDNLRQREQEEMHRKAPPTPPSPYSKPSILEQRLEEAQAQGPGFWGTIKSWFNKVPDPVPVKKDVSQPTPLPPPKSSKGKIIEEKPVSDDSGTIVNGFANWWQDLFKPSDKKNAAEVAQKVKSKIPLPSPKPSKHIDQNEPPIGVVLDVNLLPMGAQPTQVKPYTKKLWLVAGVSLLVVALVYTLFFSLITYQQVEVEKVQDKAALLADEVARLQGQFEELELVSRKMVQIKSILGSRTNWLKFFQTMESLTLPNVSFRNMSAASDGSVTLQVEALTVGELARQLQVFQQATDVIADVAISTVTVVQTEESESVSVNTTFQIKLIKNWLQKS